MRGESAAKADFISIGSKRIISPHLPSLFRDTARSIRRSRGRFYSDSGSMNRWAHIGAYESFEQRMKVREEVRAKGIWPSSSPVVPLHQENKLLLPAEFSPLQ